MPQLRSRPYTVSVQRLSKKLVINGEIYPPTDEIITGPIVRAQCDSAGRSCPYCGKRLTVDDVLGFECTNCGTVLVKARPCPFIGCRSNMWCDINWRTGSIKINMPNLQPWEVSPGMSCALDPPEQEFVCNNAEKEAERTLSEVGKMMGGISRERVRQMELNSFEKIRERHPELKLLLH